MRLGLQAQEVLITWRGRIPLVCWGVVDSAGTFTCTLSHFIGSKGIDLVGDDPSSAAYWEGQARLLANHFQVPGNIFHSFILLTDCLLVCLVEWERCFLFKPERQSSPVPSMFPGVRVARG